MLICSRNNKKTNCELETCYRTHCMVCNLSSVQFQPLNLFHFCNWTIYHCPLELCLWWWWWKIVILFQFPMPQEIIINTTAGLWVGWHWEVRRGWLPCSQFSPTFKAIHESLGWSKKPSICALLEGTYLQAWSFAHGGCVCVWIASKICLDTHSQLSAKLAIVPTLPRAMGCKWISLGEAGCGQWFWSLTSHDTWGLVI